MSELVIFGARGAAFVEAVSASGASARVEPAWRPEALAGARAIILATPHGTREGPARVALEAGCDVLVDDPFDLTAEVAGQLARFAEARGRRLHLAFRHVTEPSSRAALAALPGLGGLRSVHLERTWLGDGDLLQRLTEDLALVLAAMGPPSSIAAEGASHAHLGAIDELFLRCRWGAVEGLIHAHSAHPRPRRALAFVGASAAVTLEDGVAGRWSMEGASEPLEAEDALAEVVSALLGGGPPDATATSALRLAAQARRAVEGVEAAPAPGVHPEAFIHPTAAVDGEGVEVGAGTKIWHFSKLLGPLRIGARCSLGQNVVVERGVHIGDNVKIQNNVSVYSGVILEDDVFCGPSMVFTNVGTPRSHYPRRGEYAETRVGRGASIGANATVVCGNPLGRYCFVGAGAVVTKPVPDYALVYGNPARVRGWACFCGATLPMAVDETSEACVCVDCGRHYRRQGRKVEASDDGV